MPENTYFMGIDLGGTNIKAVVIDRRGKILVKKNIPTQSEKGVAEVIKKITTLVKNLQNELAPETILASGIAAAGAVDMQTGVCKFLTNFPSKWKDIPLAQKVNEETSVKTFLINDVRAMTLAEKTFGVGKEVENLVCITVGTGIGGGIVVDGKLYFGSEGFAGEIGHQVIQLDGPLCGCGNYGCLEALASASNISAQAIRMLKQGKATLIRELVDNDLNKVTPRIIADAARKGDPAAKKIWEKEAYYLGIGIANLVAILNPEMIVIGGGVAKAADLFLPGIKKTLRERVHVGVDINKLKIVKSKLQDWAGAVGGAGWAMSKEAH